VCAVRQGVPAAAINWSSAAAPFQGVSASRRSRLDEKATDEERVDELLDWLWDKDEEAPRLVLIYLDDLDDLAHKQGPEAPATLLAVERIDGLVRTIVDAIEDSRGKEHTTLFVLGDHGMSPAEKCVYLDPLLEQRGIVAESYVAGAVANVYLAPGSDAKAAQAALAADSPLFKAYLPAELPAAYGYVQPDRVGDLVLIGARGVYFHAGGRQPVGPPRTMGVHGLPSEDPDMRAALVAWGRGVSPGRRWEEVRIVDLYPSVCRLLGITPSAQIDGVVIPGIEAAQPTAPQP
jgi:predicted AlkP superfamily pyrophosphatase or phosphodiesterase